MDDIETYAVDLVVAGARNAIDAEQGGDGLALAIRLVDAIENNPASFLNWYQARQLEGTA